MREEYQMDEDKLRLEQMAVQLRETQARYRHVRKALEFYADIKNWNIGDSFKQSCRINENDLEYFAHHKTSDLIGGKKARQYLKDIEDSNWPL